MSNELDNLAEAVRYSKKRHKYVTRYQLDTGTKWMVNLFGLAIHIVVGIVVYANFTRIFAFFSSLFGK